MSTTVDIVIPVFNAADELADCLASVRRTAPSWAGVTIIDDASTSPAVATLLSACAADRDTAHWRIQSNPRNLGFVGTVNIGMQQAAGDVVLLNSDTITTEGWLQRLVDCARSAADVATVTPFTNNGEIASFPEFCRNNPVPDDPEQVAAACRNAGAPTYPEIPTAVGFCMYITRRAIDRIGLFDAETFGRGYGEENDFSMRAMDAGMRNLLCDDCYVVHRGGCSFQPLGLTPDDSAMQKLLAKHPDYLDIVQAFIAEDPLKPRREAIAALLENSP